METDVKPHGHGSLFKRWRRDHRFKNLTGAALSFGVTVLFALYNGLLGLHLSSVWHGGICAFYLLLAALRGLILLSERRNRTGDERQRAARRQRTFRVSAAMLLLLNLSLILPISLMAVFEKPVNMGSIPAIAMAAYTTYKLTRALLLVHGRRRDSCGDILIAELRTINLIDAMVSVLALQNTLIMVYQTEGEGREMFLLSAVSSAVIYLGIILITVRLLLGGRGENTAERGHRA